MLGLDKLSSRGSRIYEYDKVRMITVGKNVTVRDVAKVAGVSVATVSNVINDVDKVSAETKKHVLQVMEDMGYKLNMTARSLARNKSNLIGVLLPITEAGYDMSLLLKDNPFYGEFISGAEHKAVEHDYDLIITGVRPGQSCKDWIGKRNLDGAIFIGNYSRVIAEDVKQCNAKLVLIDTYDEGVAVHQTIGIDDQEGGYMATKHLLGLGHRQIAFAASTILADGVVYRRFEGFKKAMKEYGVFKPNEHIFQDTLTYEGGYRVGLELLNRLDEISAIFVAADIMALGLMRALFEHGKRVPEDLSVIGFDDISVCKYTYPGLTSIKQPIYEKGIFAVEALIRAIENKNVENKRHILPLELIKRESTRAYSTQLK